MTPTADPETTAGTSASVSGQRTRYRPRNLIFIVCLMAMLCIWFALLRGGLMWRNADLLADVPAGEFHRPFLIGLRFDFATVCYLLLPLWGVIFFPVLSADRNPRLRRLLYWLLLVVVGVVSYLLLAEYEYVHEFQVRYNQIVLTYLDQMETVGGMLWQGYPVVRYTLLWLAGMTAFALALRWMMRRVYAAPSPALSVRYCLAEGTSAILVLLALIFGLRGGFQSAPLRWGDAFKSEHDIVNQLSLNGVYVLGKTLADSTKSADATRRWVAYQSISEARDIARSMVLDSDDRLISPADSTVLHTELGGIDRLVNLKPGVTRPNVVIVIMESFSAQFTGACGAGEQHTPNFDVIARDGILFNRAFSIGTHTHQGIYGTLLSFPNLPGYESLMQTAAANQDFTSAPGIFESLGYQTMFLYNGNFSWDNMRGFFRKQGVNHFIGGSDYPATVRRDSVWGVDDAEVFKRANQEFEAAAGSGPFMGIVLTLSNHTPWDLPDYPGTAAAADQSGPVRGIRYADWALGQFISEAKTKKYFENTLFVFVGDHALRGAHSKLTAAGLLTHHIPLLFYGPGVLDSAPRVDETVASQLNVLPTILGLVDYERPHATWGTDLFTAEGRQKSFAVFKGSNGDQSAAIVRDDRALVFDAAGNAILYRYGLSGKPFAHPLPVDDPQRPMLLREMRGFIHAAVTDLRQMRAGDFLPPSGAVRVAGR